MKLRRNALPIERPDVGLHSRLFCGLDLFDDIDFFNASQRAPLRRRAEGHTQSKAALLGQVSKDHEGTGQVAMCGYKAYPSATMPNESPDLDLPVGWTCWLELKQDADGACSGKAELREGLETRCVFVLAQQATHEAVLERLKLRADHFIDEWQARAAENSGQKKAGSIE